MLFLAGLSWRFVAAGAALAMPLLYALVISVPYRRARLFAFLDPDRDPLGSGFQALQSLIAVGSGGLFGLGPGNSVQKLYFLPHPQSDFIYAIVAEELGMLGALAVVALFALLLWRGLRAGWRAPDPFGRYLAWGFTAMLVLQALVNISVAIALLPTKGIPLPFLSYGGSSLVVSLAICGVLLNVSQHD
jgi:cell division protein FtsW